ncbi:hypothetical protein EIP91_002550 [Steccherinum ochraceum]|uniref:Ribosomal L1 domain-containing protein 1 n=1 Tax=Steccherinum ochraceum TaxID=92696 RepID=A0A4R0RDT7_9APHY|nr:hypothetical protein EIP91_002550 [Steccherinum ochraceum]
MAKKTAPELIDEHVSVGQSEKAVDALLKHVHKIQEEKAKTELVEGREQHIWLQLTVKQMQPEKKLKPIKLPIAHPLVDPRESNVCLITKDPQREYKDLLEKNGIKFVHRVTGISKLKGKFKGFEERRMLLKENELFLADERVIPLLPALLGSKFFKAKKQPIPVCLTRKDLKGELERAISSTYFHQNQGTCSSIKIGAPSHSSTQIVANLKSALPVLVKHLKGGWDNVQSLHIKTSNSISLPIWTCDLGSDEGGRWDGLVAEDVEMSGSDDESEEEDGAMVVEEGKAAEEEVKTTKKGKKRAAEEDAPTPKKKAKSDEGDVKKGSKKLKVTADEAERTAPGEAVTTSAVSAPIKAKKEKKEKATKVAAPAPSTSAATLETSSTDITDKAAPSKKKKRASAAPETIISETPASFSKSAAVTPAPVTPSSTKKTKTPRALATDFFDATPASAAPTSAPPPPNTPADGLVADTPAPSGKKKRKGKGVEATPLSAAIEKLADDAPEATPSKAQVVTDEAVTPAEKPARKPRHKKRASEIGAENVEATPVKTPSKEVKVAETPELSTKELKQKRSAAGGEKKKEKVAKSKLSGQSAKEALIGKKGLKA